MKFSTVEGYVHMKDMPYSIFDVEGADRWRIHKEGVPEMTHEGIYGIAVNGDIILFVPESHPLFNFYVVKSFCNHLMYSMVKAPTTFQNWRAFTHAVKKMITTKHLEPFSKLVP